MANKKIDYIKICREMEELHTQLIERIDMTIPVYELDDYDRALGFCAYEIDDILQRNGYYERYKNMEAVKAESEEV